MMLRIFILLFFVHLASASKSKLLLFPKKSGTSYVHLTPKKPLNLQAFTLCMRVSAELGSKRDIILFAYRTQDYDELNVWQESDGRLSLYLSSNDAALFTLPTLSAMPTHLCVTWDSSTGATMFWVNGQRSMVKIYRKGHRVNSDGAVILGQDPDSYLGKFNFKQSFVGEITDVHMWDNVLSAGQIKLLYEKQHCVPTGNVIDWNSLDYEVFGNVVEVSELDV